MPAYQYVLRFDDRDEVLLVECDAHEVGQRVELGGSLWVVESIVPTLRWKDVQRVILSRADRLSESMPAPPAAPPLEVAADRTSGDAS